MESNLTREYHLGASIIIYSFTFYIVFEQDMPDIPINKETLNFDEAKNTQTKWRYSSAAEYSPSVLEAPGSIPGISTNDYSNESVDNCATFQKRITNESVDKSVNLQERKNDENIDDSTNSKERENNKNVDESINSQERKNNESVDKSATSQGEKSNENSDNSTNSRETSNKCIDMTAYLQERTTNRNLDKSANSPGIITKTYSLDKSTTSQERTTNEGVDKSANSQEKTTNETVDNSAILEERTTNETRRLSALFPHLPIQHGHKTENSQERIKQHFNIVSHSVSVIFFMWLMASPVSCVQMDWGENPNLVKESKPIQGREHIKLLVALVGESIDLECQVLFTSQPIGKITWKNNGASMINSEKYIVETNQDGVFVEEHFKIDKVTEDMDGSTLTCGYAKGEYADRVEAVLTVFKLDIEGDICETGTGNLKLIFKESKRSSQDEKNMDRRIRAKIAELTGERRARRAAHMDEINMQNDEYSVTLPSDIVKKNQEIIAMKPELFENVENPGCPGEDGILGTWILCGSLSILFGSLIILVFVFLYRKRKREKLRSKTLNENLNGNNIWNVNDEEENLTWNSSQ
eukprot:GFUD01006334.1.p1 GENE.GFUD01006334.1~~GFUD01006334.1.p1  ORF type:complete len:582 (-),score=133.69 GFUD01006334.1:109-1854(-)